MLYFSNVFQSLIAGVGIPLLRTWWWWWSKLTCVLIKGKNRVPITKFNGFLSAPPSWIFWNISYYWQTLLTLVSMTLCCPGCSDFSDNCCMTPLTSLFLPFSWLSALIFYMCFLSGLFYSCVLPTQFSNFGLLPKHQFYNAMFHLHLTHNIWYRTHLKQTLTSDLFLWRAPLFANEPKLETPAHLFFFFPFSRTHSGQHQVLLGYFTQSLLYLSNSNGNQLGAGPPSFSCDSISIC